MIITTLGSGTSSGVPNVAFGFGDCNPANAKNQRLRCSLFIEVGREKILIDTSPDLRQQLLRANISDLTAVLYTHDHADHCHGIDDLRPIVGKRGAPLPAYFTAATATSIQKKFSYIFTTPSHLPASDYPPLLVPHVIDGVFYVGEEKITAFTQQHGHSISTGFRIGNFAYSTDVSHLDESAFAVLAGVELWVVDALQPKPHGSHSHLDRTLEWIARVKPKRAYLTHMNIAMDYDWARDHCPPGVAPLYDGLVLEL